jgi:hypothetical protein
VVRHELCLCAPQERSVKEAVGSALCHLQAHARQHFGALITPKPLALPCPVEARSAAGYS